MQPDTVEPETRAGPPRPGGPLALVMVGVAAVLFVAYCLQFPLIFEDAFIFYRFADSLASGHGLSFNPGTAVEGYTSFAWVLVLAVCRFLVEDLQAVAPWVSLAAGLATLLCAFQLARTIVPNEPRAAAATVGFVAVNGSLAMYAVSGMETTLFALLVTLSLLHACRGSEDGAHALRGDLVFAGVLLLTALTRPEGVGYAGLCTLGAVPRRGWQRAFRAAGMAAAVYAAYFLWRWDYFGHPLPNTYYAKQGSTLGLGLGYVEGYLYGHVGLLGLIGAGIALWQRRPWAAPVGLVLAGGLVMAMVVGGDIFPLHRFLVPIVPVAGATTVFLIWATTSRLQARVRMLARLGLALGAGAVVFSAPHVGHPALFGRPPGPPDDWSKLQRNARFTRNYERIASWMNRSLPADFTLAINAAGVIPYRTRLRTIDMLGLADEHIAHRPVPEGPIALGHAKSDPDYVLAQRPDVIIPGLPFVVSKPPSETELMRMWAPVLLPGDRALMDSPEFHRTYGIVVAQVDAAGFTALFVRRDRIPLLGLGRK